jgi:hypothetical protein
MNLFNISSVFVHSGDVFSGHYFVYIKPNPDSDQWFLFNDENVSTATKIQAIEANYGGKSSTNACKTRKFQENFINKTIECRYFDLYPKITKSKNFGPGGPGRCSSQRKKKNSTKKKNF